MKRLISAKRVIPAGDTLRYVLYVDDYPVSPLSNVWVDTGGVAEKHYVVQTSDKVIDRCILMTTDPGDLILDPTCGSGTTAYCAEKWGRRWITCDTSRVAVVLARQRLMTAAFSYYALLSAASGVSGGFTYEKVPHVTLGSITRSETSGEETLYDKPLVDREKLRVSGPFTVEAIPASSTIDSSGPREESVDEIRSHPEAAADHVANMIELLRAEGVTFAGGKVLHIGNLRPISSSGFLHAEGETSQEGGNARIAISFGPRFGPVGTRQVDEAMRSAYRMGCDLLIFAGFAFEPEAQTMITKNPLPKLSVHFANISPDVIVGDLLKPARKNQLFAVIGHPDIRIGNQGSSIVVELLGLDIYDPQTGEVHSSSGSEIPAWFLDEDYDGFTFRVCQAFFPKEATKVNPWDRLENALRGTIDKERIETFRGLKSLPFTPGNEQRIAVKVIDPRGNELMIALPLGEA